MYKKIFEKLREEGRVQCATLLNGPLMGSKLISSGGETWIEGAADQQFWTQYREILHVSKDTGVLEIGGHEFLVELFLEHPHMVICGGGHVSVPVYKIAKMLGFHVTVVDDRREFVARERFPEADCLLCADFAELEKEVPAYGNSFYVVLTRGHGGDELCARQILGRPFTYLGMIGSRTKVSLTKERLRLQGFSQEQIESMHAPIGLKIGGQTPEEIAVSIMAEVVQVNNQHPTAYADDQVVQAAVQESGGVMATIISKKGSSPRGVGSKMLVAQDGTIYGTIGGGSVEYEAGIFAKKAERTQIREYDLSIGNAQNLGMICGGHVEVLFEVL